MLTPEQKAVLFFIIVCLGVILLGALKERYVAQELQDEEGCDYCDATGFACGAADCPYTENDEIHFV